VRHKLTVEIDEGFITKLMVDGQAVGLVQKFEFFTAVGESMPKGVIEIKKLDKHQQDIINMLMEIPWLKVDAHE
jgi:hypothetical protein